LFLSRSNSSLVLYEEREKESFPRPSSPPRVHFNLAERFSSFEEADRLSPSFASKRKESLLLDAGFFPSLQKEKKRTTLLLRWSNDDDDDRSNSLFPPPTPNHMSSLDLLEALDGLLGGLLDMMPRDWTRIFAEALT